MVQLKKSLNKILVTSFLSILVASASHAAPKAIVNGWHKVLVNGNHAGYLIQDFAFDQKSKQFVATSFSRIQLPGQEIVRSLKAFSNDKLSPVAYQYTEKSGTSTKLVDAVIDKEVLTAKFTINGKEEAPRQFKLQKGAIHGIFLYLLMITNKTGVKKGTYLSYVAISEDTATPHVGAVDVVDLETVDGLETIKITNTYNNSKTVENITPTAQIVRTKDPFSNIETRLVASQAEAVGGLPFSAESIKILFGQVPKESFPKPIASTAIEPSSQNPLPKGVGAPPAKGMGPKSEQKKSK
jgi:hypothetical protein